MTSPAPNERPTAYADRPAAAPSRHATECKLASLLVIARQLTGRPLVATAVGFRHPAPADVALHARVFGVAPRFAAADDVLELAAAELDAPCPDADPALWRIVERHAEACSPPARRRRSSPPASATT